MKICPLAPRNIATYNPEDKKMVATHPDRIFGCVTDCQWHKNEDCRLIVALERIAEGLRK